MFGTRFRKLQFVKRAIRKNTFLGTITVIDPNSDVLKRYVDLLKPKRVNYFAKAKAFIESS